MTKTEIKYHDVSRETFEAVNELFDQFHPVLETYILRLLWWNQTVNLVSRNATIDSIRDHVMHSLFPALLPGFQNNDLILDAGSGGGLPGIPLALSFFEKTLVLNDISSKKTGVLNHLKRELSINNVVIANSPLKEYSSAHSDVKCIISKHAFKLIDILNDIRDGNWDTLIMLKGDDFRNEIEGIPYPVFINCYRLESGTTLPFYQGKVMLNIQRMS